MNHLAFSNETLMPPPNFEPTGIAKQHAHSIIYYILAVVSTTMITIMARNRIPTSRRQWMAMSPTDHVVIMQHFFGYITVFVFCLLDGISPGMLSDATCQLAAYLCFVGIFVQVVLLGFTLIEMTRNLKATNRFRPRWQDRMYLTHSICCFVVALPLLSILCYKTSPTCYGHGCIVLLPTEGLAPILVYLATASVYFSFRFCISFLRSQDRVLKRHSLRVAIGALICYGVTWIAVIVFICHPKQPIFNLVTFGICDVLLTAAACHFLIAGPTKYKDAPRISTTPSPISNSEQTRYPGQVNDPTLPYSQKFPLHFVRPLDETRYAQKSDKQGFGNTDTMKGVDVNVLSQPIASPEELFEYVSKASADSHGYDQQKAAWKTQAQRGHECKSGFVLESRPEIDLAKQETPTPKTVDEPSYDITTPKHQRISVEQTWPPHMSGPYNFSLNQDLDAGRSEAPSPRMVMDTGRRWDADHTAMRRADLYACDTPDTRSLIGHEDPVVQSDANPTTSAPGSFMPMSKGEPVLEERQRQDSSVLGALDLPKLSQHDSTMHE